MNKRHTEWNREVLASSESVLQPESSLPKSTRYGLLRRNHGQFLISDSHEIDSTTSWWTEKQSECQVYYDLENAFRCAGILASITNEDIEVVALD